MRLWNLLPVPPRRLGAALFVLVCGWLNSSPLLAQPAGEPSPGPSEQGFPKVGALVQFWAFASTVDDQTTAAFRLRRAELKLSGEFVPDTFAYELMVDPAQVLEPRRERVPVEYEGPEGVPAAVEVPVPDGRLSLLQDVAITALTEYADISVGQFKNGLSYEGYNSSSKLLFPERAAVARYYGDARDLGVRVRKDLGGVNYFVGVFNGSGANRRDQNRQKDLAVRLEVLPLEGLLLGAVGYASLGQRGQATTRDRIEADVRLDVANVLFQAEYLRGWDGPASESVEGHGFYATLGYTFLGQLQPVVRLGRLDTDLDASGNRLAHYDFGLNAFALGRKARLGASFSILDFESSPTQTDVILLAQAAF